MGQRLAAAVCARISQDRSGDDLGVRRQVADCRAEAARRGWVVAQEYVDDDVSAFSGRVRPAYERMLSDIAEGRRDAVMVWHLDRLHRRPVELERFVDVCTRAGVSDVVTLSGAVDLANGDGLLMARLLAAVAANESASKSRRLMRKSLEVAESGRPVMGGPRPFGFNADKVTHHPVEAPIVADLAARALAGETLTSLVTWLQEMQVPTVTGGVWRTTALRQVLTNPRMWGQRVHEGQVIGEGAWKPIISVEQGERLRRLLLDPSRRTNRSARRYLLSGMLTCGKCGRAMHSAPKGAVRRYECTSGPDSGGCGGVFVNADRLERFITDAVLFRPDSPEMTRTLTTAPDHDEQVQGLAGAIEADDARLRDLAELFADGDIGRAEWMTARTRIEPRLAANRRDLAHLTGRAAVLDYAGRGDELRQGWESLNLSRQVGIVKAVLAGATILPATVRGRHDLDPNRVVPAWRV